MVAMTKLVLLTAFAIVSTTISVSHGQFHTGPRYSLDNMPKTSFSCRDKILGGYYADSETQCQMFHVCVKVAGIGVQDFRFLCPNGTAFDQEAQICADWGDVDCEAATLYYGSDNFDLYRLGSGFESKRAPYAEEEEATFHLQRAETSDARRSKQFIVNQSAKNQQASLYNPNQIPQVHRPQHHQQRQQQPSTTTTTTTTAQPPATAQTTESYSNNNKGNLQYQKQIQQKHLQHKQQQLIFNQQQQIQQQHYRQLTAAAATATPSDRKQNEAIRSTTASTFVTTTQKPFQPQQQQQQQQQQRNDYNNDEIFRGSHSSHFFNNRNNGKEDFEDDYVRKPASTTSTIAPTTSATAKAQTRGRNRGRGSVRAHNLNIVQSVAKPTPGQQQTRLQSTTPEDFVDVPKIQNFNRGTNNFRQQPTTILQPQNGNQINFAQQPASTPAPFSRTQQRPAQNLTSSRSSQAFFVHQQINTTPAKVAQSPQQYQTTPSIPHNHHQRFHAITTTPAPEFKIAVTTPKSHFNNINNQQYFQQSTTTQSPNFSGQFFNRNDFRTSTTTFAPPQQHFNRVTQAPQFYNTGFENKATERTFNEAITTPQEPQRIRAQSRNYNIDQGRLNQFNYDEYLVSRTSSTTSTTTTAPTTTAAAFENVKPSTYNPLSYRAQPQIQPRQQPQSQHLNPFDPRSTPLAHSTTTTSTTTTTQRPNVANERYQTISRNANDNNTPSTIKKFSTLVPKELYNPTTFKPNAFSKKALLQFVIQKPDPKPQEKVNPAPPKSTIYVPTVPPVTTSTTTTTASPVQRKPQQIQFFQQPQLAFNAPSTTTTTTTKRPDQIDEDDGQYHPELYEKDFYRNRVRTKTGNGNNNKAAQDQLTASRNNFFQQSTPVSQSLSSGSDEDEIFRTAHSQNIAASGNDLILERARQAAAKINEFLLSSSVKPTQTPPTRKTAHQSSSSSSRASSSSSDGKANSRVNPRPFSKAPTIPPNATSTKRPSDDKDEYDYAYYDLGNHDIPEYEVIEDFGRTSKKKKN
ncbi:putative mediator of RNA polymerase II transcription subunit 26 isoform X1 [Uranotaenia lowii]|uniref:putative mediator of RNA polymerase II transcription subunit 26 isoform X1 n=1 Tax=Uranotaenia lowii TaxID=190385 RepID=UPI002478B6E6|nr:putative mediator of RNA polymerase II transcription subunit 26 isoform X1 [Uranotaenia lowii]